MKKRWFILLLFCISFLTACSPSTPSSGTQNFQATYKTETIHLSKLPQKIVPLTSSLLNMLYAVNGKAIARPNTTTPIPLSAQQLPEIGQTAHINAESLITLNPDFVLGLQSQNKKLTPILDANHIPYLLVDYDGIDDNVPILKFLGELTGNQEYANKIIKQYEADIQKVESRAQKYPPVRVIVLRATGKDITAEMPLAITSSMVEKLGMYNIVKDFSNLPKDTKTVPFSLETLANADPDIIFIVTMGKVDLIQKKIQSELANNPAWQSMKATRNKRIYYLPSDLFLLNPGMRTPDAMNILVDLAYPQ